VNIIHDLSYRHKTTKIQFKAPISGGVKIAHSLKKFQQVWYTTQKKEPELQQVNKTVLKYLHPEQVEVEICRADELAQRRGWTSELDAMWSYGSQKAEPRW